MSTNQNHTQYSISRAFNKDSRWKSETHHMWMLIMIIYINNSTLTYYSAVNRIKCIMYAYRSNDCFSLNHNRGIHLNENDLNASIKTVIYVFYTLLMWSEDALSDRLYFIAIIISLILIGNCIGPLSGCIEILFARCKMEWFYPLAKALMSLIWRLLTVFVIWITVAGVTVRLWSKSYYQIVNQSFWDFPW